MVVLASGPPAPVTAREVRAAAGTSALGVGGGPYGGSHDHSQPTVPFLNSSRGQRRDTQVPPYEGNVTPFVGRHLCVPPCRVSILINVFMVAGGTVYFVGADDSVRPPAGCYTRRHLAPPGMSVISTPMALS